MLFYYRLLTFFNNMIHVIFLWVVNYLILIYTIKQNYEYEKSKL